MKSTTVQLYLLVTLVVLSSVATPGECLVDPHIPNIFYPFGTDRGDIIGPIQDDGLPAINMPGGFRYFGTSKRSLYVRILQYDVSFAQSQHD